MTIEQHRDYDHELQRLEETKTYIQFVLHESEHNEDAFRADIKEAYQRLNSLDSSEGYIALLTSAKFLDMTQQSLRQLQQVQQRPYFCRIDVRPEHTETIQPLYIGKASLFRPDTQEPVIVDWRSPIANVYYEGRIGEISYETTTGTERGELYRKRQYTIDKGQLQDFRDIDITTRDELLQESLGGSADSRLKDIVSTIQEEQNRVIRAEMYRPMIVQGAAGSGKTTIALHRIAYLIYTYGDKFNPDQFMILAPHQLFLKYIADVLPELGVDAVRQTTYIDFVSEGLGKKLNLADPNERLFRFLNGDEDTEQLKFVSLYKGSVAYKQQIDDYLEALTVRMLPQKDFKLGKHMLYAVADLRKFFREDYVRLPIYKRVEKIKKILADRLKVKKKQMLQEIVDHYDHEIDQAFARYKVPEQRRTQVVKLMDAKENLLKKVEALSKTLVKEYMTQFPKQDLIAHYREFLQGLPDESLQYLQTYTTALLDKKQMELEDTPALLYLQHKLFGLKEEFKIRNLVIDEAQDYSVFQLVTLKEVLGTEMFTILGDLSQGIHSYRGVQSWEEVLREVFPSGNCNYLVLEQSYRTTVEIMELANRVIVHSNTPGLVLAKPVVRHGEQPTQEVFTEEQALIAQVLADVLELKGQGLGSMAVIGKTMAECQRIKERFDALATHLSIQVLDEKEDYAGNDVVIVPSYVVKGLEFDAVFIVNLEEQYTADDLDVKLLYVAMTRPLHRLFVYSMAGQTGLLDVI
ncbi:RNA polymerase recycling motor HelD [Tumebacillus permanentifrigoris]|uniref:DNA helicase-2/ATP-dependent DNA helicase PcrA n=1 Tax=Tumebacillus permanentifrigoris TaxID=378543 RepID=A0A316DBL2_9BACL|nr:RNA polymerase recycling motor HelD [Tumebacillus permanentifrigoris]PWK14966.1 DNA helicase-2/ATP-dependent DNA helicase PcrA [Tumebacillus permanentifrigoris]